MTAPLRRVVSGLDASGQSCIQIDGPSDTIIWTTESSPADNSGTADAGAVDHRMALPAGATQFSHHLLQPGVAIPMHTTDTVDYCIIVSGEIWFVTETGETLLKPGDVVVDRGVAHTWRNDGPEPCHTVMVMIPALPLKGAA